MATCGGEACRATPLSVPTAFAAAAGEAQQERSGHSVLRPLKPKPFGAHALATGWNDGDSHVVRHTKDEIEQNPDGFRIQ